jgi:hypothetical protein
MFSEPIAKVNTEARKDGVMYDVPFCFDSRNRSQVWPGSEDELIEQHPFRFSDEAA